MVIATQNPVEHHGTYPLPESQLDRFLMRLRIGYPDAASEREILRNFADVNGTPIERVLSGRGRPAAAGHGASRRRWMNRWSITCSPSSRKRARTNRSRSA